MVFEQLANSFSLKGTLGATPPRSTCGESAIQILTPIGNWRLFIREQANKLSGVRILDDV